jgi:MoaA/NifB/PqqE/SkfB family radical SAM enzyme
MNKTLSVLHGVYLEAKRRITGKEFIAEFDVTDNCNLRCKHCYHFYDKKHMHYEEEPIEVWEKRLKELYDSGIRFLLIVGGEPALRSDVLMLADKMFPIIFIITNGTIKVPDEFRHTLFVSVDGSEETSDSIRGKGAFARVLTNYSGDRRAIINMTLTKQNYKELEDVVKIARDKGLRGVVCNLFTPAINSKSPLMIEKAERANIIAEMKRVKAKFPDDYLLSESMVRWYEEADHRGACYWGSNALHMDAKWNRRHCFSNNADCSNCGCFAGAIQISPMRILDSKELMKIIFH